MATGKLTLSADKDTIDLAKRLASGDNISVSKLFKTLITDLAKKKSKKDPILEKYKDVEIPQWIQDLTGVAKDDPTMSYDEMKYAYFKERNDL
jgi:hypothetical protein